MVNNAGISPVAPADVPALDLADWDRVLRVNLLGVVHGVAAAYPLLVRQGAGAMLSTASLAGLVPGPGLGVYAAAKHAVVGYTLSLRAQAARYGVRVVTLCPGWVDTPLLDVPLPDSTGTTSTAREQLAAFGVGRPVPAGEVAAAALDGVRRNQALVVVPRDARWAWRMHRYLPALSDRVARRIALRQPPYRLAGSPSTPLQARVPGS
jgi:NAD(P)-dependent dehydrogenase (short-subunit alcohol dehydrogenase family)